MIIPKEVLVDTVDVTSDGFKAVPPTPADSTSIDLLKFEIEQLKEQNYKLHLKALKGEDSGGGFLLLVIGMIIGAVLMGCLAGAIVTDLSKKKADAGVSLVRDA